MNEIPLSRPIGTFYEFFAGGGMARAGLGPSWHCLFANDLDEKKSAAYEANWGADGLKVADVASLTPADLPGHADLAWASFPCQDLSLAGAGAGLKGARSGTFWAFWQLIDALAMEGRAPRIVALENVCGAVTSHNGEDFAAIATALARTGYRFGAVVIDAARFLPQSRPRLFVIGVYGASPILDDLTALEVTAPWHTPALINAEKKLPPLAREAWVWWRLPQPPMRNTTLSDLVEAEPTSVVWHTEQETRRLLELMSPVNLAKVEEARASGRCAVGTIYKRTRVNENGVKTQRAEVRFDEIAGCLRTPAGGSSRQTIMIVQGDLIRSRLLSSREAARLMGLPDDYILPSRYNEAYHLLGDGVAVPAVRFLAANLFERILATKPFARRKAA